MSYEEYRRIPYKANCACGEGYLKYQKILLSNDWNQEKENNTKVEIHCDYCADKYHYECINSKYNSDDGDSYLVPNGLTLKIKEPQLSYENHYNFKEEIAKEYGINGIKEIISDMSAPKHRYIRDLTSANAVKFANDWIRRYGKKSLKPMIDFLHEILEDFDNIKAIYENKQLAQKEYFEKRKAYDEEFNIIKQQSFKLTFHPDYEEEKEILEQSKQKRKEYAEAHKYDSFEAQVKYDVSFIKDWTNQYWDTYLIVECTEPQYMTLSKPIAGTPEIIIAKKYKCKCQLCGEEINVVSSDFKISFDSEIGYYPQPCCSCHSVSSFEAKVMEILNNLGITYVREKSFNGLVGDYGNSLRFDFGLYNGKRESGEPIIDLLIELQGPHHYQEGYYDEEGDFIKEDDSIDTLQKRLNRQIRYDNQKKEFCLDKGINLECIKYTISNDYERLEQKLIEILQKYGYNYLK